MRPLRAVTLGPYASCEVVRPDLCPFVRSVLGGILAGTEPFTGVDAWAGMYTCDMTRRLFQELPRLTGKPVFPLQLPAVRSEVSAEWFASSVRDLCQALITSGFSEGYDAGEAMEWERGRVAGAFLLREAALDFRLPPTELQERFWAFFTENRFSREAVSGGYAPRVQVAVTGSTLARGDDTVPATLEELGAGYLPLGCTGLGGLPNTLPEDGGFRSLARRAVRETRCIRNRPNAGTFSWILEQAEGAGCHGLVVKTLSFCDLWYTEKERFKTLPIPVLVLQSDLSPGDRGRSAVRLQAFVETLEDRLD